MTTAELAEVEVLVADWVHPGFPQLGIDHGQLPLALVVLVHPQDVEKVPSQAAG